MGLALCSASAEKVSPNGPKGGSQKITEYSLLYKDL